MKLSSVRLSVCLSVCPIIRRPHAATAGLLLLACGGRRAGKRYLLTAAAAGLPVTRRSAANASSVMLSAEEAEHRLVELSAVAATYAASVLTAYRPTCYRPTARPTVPCVREHYYEAGGKKAPNALQSFKRHLKTFLLQQSFRLAL